MKIPCPPGRGVEGTGVEGTGVECGGLGAVSLLSLRLSSSLSLESGLVLDLRRLGGISNELIWQTNKQIGGSGFRVQGSGFRVQGSGLKVWGSGFNGFQGLGLRTQG